MVETLLAISPLPLLPKKIPVMKIAVLGFGHCPSAENLEIAAIAGEQLALAGHCVVVGNLLGTFAAAIESAEAHGGQTMAVVDQTIAPNAHSALTEVLVVESSEKHQAIAEMADAGLVLGGAEGTRKLAAKLLAEGKPLIAVKGTGGAVDDQSLPVAVSVADSIDQALELLLAKLGELERSEV